MDILEWCGFTHGRVFWQAPDEEDDADLHGEPDLDMNFFFKYVVPKLKDMFDSDKVASFLMHWAEELARCDIDPNEAWQEALRRLIENCR